MPDSAVNLSNVSRETLEKLKSFEALVSKWTRKINLVAPSTLSAIWERHIEDSIQIAHLSDTPDKWVDIGSGGGFPGIVVAIIQREINPSASMTLIESDKRKAAFLMSAARELNTLVTVAADRIENVPAMEATTLSARALAPLPQLFEYAERHLHKDGTALFLKGQDWKRELEEAQQKWCFRCDVINSKTNAESAILKIKKIERK